MGSAPLRREAPPLLARKNSLEKHREEMRKKKERDMMIVEMKHSKTVREVVLSSCRG
jgi:hypothetical protein